MSAKNWVFTAYGETINFITSLSQLPTGLSYLFGQIERCPNTNRQHFQGYCQLSRKGRFSVIKRALNDDALHCEIARGTLEENQAYCSKDECRVAGPFELGTPSVQGQRMDLEQYYLDIKSGKSLKQIADNNPQCFIKYPNAINRIRKLFEDPIEIKYKLTDFNQPPCDLSKSVLICGESGIGKTHFALAHFNSPLWVKHIDDLGNFSKYDHDGIVFDDLNFEHRFDALNLVEMEFPTAIHIRYTVAYLPKGTKRIFTFNSENLFKVLPEQESALARRLTVYKFYEKLYD